VLKRHLAYDPDLDRMMKLSELRQEYLAHVNAEPEDALEAEEAEMAMSGKAATYFESQCSSVPFCDSVLTSRFPDEKRQTDGNNGHSVDYKSGKTL
jgi:hypothetical protein